MTIDSSQHPPVALTAMCPPEWGVAQGRGNLRVSCYQVVGPSRAALIEFSRHPVQFMGSMVRVFLGTIDYLPPCEMTFKPWTGEGLPDIVVNGPPQTTAPYGAYLLVLMP